MGRYHYLLTLVTSGLLVHTFYIVMGGIPGSYTKILESHFIIRFITGRKNMAIQVVDSNNSHFINIRRPGWNRCPA